MEDQSEARESAEGGSQRLARSTLSSLAWMLSGSGIQTVLRILIFAVLARLLTKADFGLVAAVLIVIQFSDGFAVMGMSRALVQRVEPAPVYVRTGFTVSLLLAAFVALIVWALAPALASLLRIPDLVLPLRVTVAVFPLRGLGVVADALLRREMRFGTLARVGLLSYAVGYGVIGIGLAVLGYGVWALVAAYLTQIGLQSILFLIVQPHPKRPEINVAAAKDLFYFGGGVLTGGVFNWAANQADNLVVGRWLGVAALGVYGRAYNLMATGVSFFGGVLDEVIFPAFAKIQLDRPRVSAAFVRVAGLTSLVSLPLGALLLATAPELIVVMMGPTWGEVILPFQILVAGMLFRNGQKVAAAVSKAMGAVYQNAVRNAIYAMAVFGGAWFGRQWGIPGVAIGTSFALALNYSLLYGLVVHLTGTRVRDLMGAHVPGVVLAAAAWGVATVTAMSLRGLGTNPAVILVFATGSVAVMVLGLLRFAPNLLGPDAAWLFRQFDELLPRQGPLSLLRRWAPMPPR
jgi:O-antigen/teichoic acid export membrane protein